MKQKKTFNIPVTWEVFAVIEVEASTIEEALDIARDDEQIIPLPTDNDYVDGSWRVTEGCTKAEILSSYN